MILAGLPAGYSEMRTAKSYVFCSLSATKLQGMVAVGDVVVVVVVRQTAGHGGLRWRCCCRCRSPICRVWCDERCQVLLILITSRDQTARYGGRCCCFCCFCCCDFWWMFQGLGRLLNFKIVFEECFRFRRCCWKCGGLRGNDFTRARATKWAKVSILPRRHAHAATPSSNNNIIYRIYYLFNSKRTRW